MIILFYVVISILLGISAFTGRPFFFLLLPLLIPFSLALIILSPEKEKSYSDTPSVVQHHHKACEYCHHQNLEPSQRKIELVVPNDSSVDAQVTSGNNTINITDL